MGSIKLDRIDASFISELRHYSRQLVREWGFTNTTVAGTCYPAGAVHALMEISFNEGIMSAELCKPLNIDKSGVSRVVKKLVEAGEIEEQFDGGAAGKGDGRVKRLVLSAKGKETVAGVDAYGDHQVASALSRLPPTTSQTTVLEGIRAYATAMRSSRLDIPLTPPPEISPSIQPQFPPQVQESEIKIIPGYRTGIAARTIEMQMSFYGPHTSFGFGVVFEGKLASGLAALLPRLDGIRNQVWCAVQAAGDGSEKVVGVVWINGEDLNAKSTDGEQEDGKGGDGGKKAHLRFFIVDDSARGKGVGKKLLTEAVNFCDEKGFEECQLWTFKGLSAARKLYDGLGFEIVSEVIAQPWDVEILLQHMTRKRGGGVA